eukprot:TRINITY_DN6460_c0_g1_i5.p1 TRINITY_DN6460_c0_g1~~TRINITY_DN6460_c0_g1_i5.p1  ORF type:complete len:307 (-),score=108.93 TRINITY_DN6460_c0_g1_i5:127-1008(-)
MGNLERIPRDITNIFLIAEITKLPQMLANIGDYASATYKLSEFVNNITIGETFITKEFRLEEVRDPNAENPELVKPYLFAYHLFREAKSGQWMAEDLRQAKGIASLGQMIDSIGDAVAAHINEDFFGVRHLFDLESAREKESQVAQGDGSTKVAKKEKDATKGEQKKPARRESAPLFDLFSGQGLHDPQNFSFTSGPFEFEVNELLDVFIPKVEDALNTQHEWLLPNAFWGHEFKFNGKPLRRVRTFLRYETIADFVIELKPEPPKPEEIPVTNEDELVDANLNIIEDEDDQS